MQNTLFSFLQRPALYAPGTSQFWNDPYISSHVLGAHLNPEEESASRHPSFMNRSVLWVASLFPPTQHPSLLDLGCGPGLYAERFCRAGYRVTAIDFSRGSVAYAKEQAAQNGHEITYHCRDYLTLDFDSAFDLVTLIYCDFGVLSTSSRALLLGKIRRALKPGGRLLFDVFTPAQHLGKPETKDWQFHESDSFWAAGPHLCLHAFYRYDADDTVLNQTVVIKEKETISYHIWEHCFTESSLAAEIQRAGFSSYKLYGDFSGKPYLPDGNTICAVVTK